MAISTTGRVWSNLAIHPGESLAEEIEFRGMSQKELATRMGRPPQVVNEIIRGKKAITPETALELEAVLSIPAQFWTNLQAIYETTLARNKELEGLEDEVVLLTEFPVRELEKRRWITRKTEKTEKVRVLREFFGIAALRDYERVNAGAFRVTGRRDYSPNALAAWLRKGQLEAAQVEADAYDRERFAEVVKQIRGYTCKSPREFLPEMKKACASAGVILLVTQELPRSGANGVARWLTPEKPLVQLSLKWRWADVFWFTFFHEAAHVLQHRRAGFVHVGTNDIDSPEEREANRFATDILIPPSSWDGFVNAKVFDETSVCSFASRVGVDVGIVVGRLHHEKLLPYNRLSHLKKRFVWEEATT